MDLNSEILTNRVSVTVTCPIPQYYEYIVSASSTGNPGKNYLYVYILDVRAEKDFITWLTQVPISSQFTSIAWTPLGQDTEDHSLGYIIGGHSDGSITWWDVTTIVQSANNPEQSVDFCCVSNQKLLASRINVISINVKPHLFATGSNEVCIMSIDKQMQVSIAVNCEAPAEGGEFTSLTWNEKVSHILATSTDTGMTYIYDMKKCELFLSILDQSLLDDSGKSNAPLSTALQWYSDGAQIIIAYDHQEYNYLTQYHMKQPNAPSAMYQTGHNAPIIDMAKNTADKNYLLSWGRDNAVVCWSMRTKKTVCKVELKEPCTQILWSNKINDAFIYITTTGKLGLERINFTEDSDGSVADLPPKWWIKPCGASFAFGGKWYAFNQKNQGMISISKWTGHKEFVETVKSFISKAEKTDLNEVLTDKINSSAESKHSSLALFWAALKSIYGNNIDNLFKEMGLDKEKLAQEVGAALGKTKKKDTNARELYQPQIEETEEDLGKWFEKPVQPTIEKVQQNAWTKIEMQENPSTVQESYTRNINWNVGHEKLIKQSLWIGDWESAIELLFKNNRHSEALLIASYQPELFRKAKETFFSNNIDLFIKSILPAIIDNNFDLLFDYNVAKEWKEYLWYSKTYLGDSVQFNQFADKLGDKLSNNIDIYASLVCYVLANKYEKCIELLVNNYRKESEKAGREDKKVLLQNIFEQVLIVDKIMNTYSKIQNQSYNTIWYKYCVMLIDEGWNVEASTYWLGIRDTNREALELYDRIYYNCENEIGKQFAKPNYPYNLIVIRPKLTAQQQKFSGSSHTQSANNMGTMNRGGFKKIMPSGVGNSGQLDNNSGINSKLPPSTTKPMNAQQMNRFGQQTQQNVGGNVVPPTQAVPAQRPQETIKPPTPLNRGPGNFYPNKPPVLQNKMNNTSTNPGANNANQGGFEESYPQQEVKKQAVNFGGSNRAFEGIAKPPAFRNINPPMNKPKIQEPNPNTINNQQSNFENQPQTKPQQPTPFGNKKQVPSTTHPEPVQQTQSMSQDETTIHDYFKNYVSIYNSVFTDENKQKDFGNKINVLLGKWQGREWKPNLIKWLIDFIGSNEPKDIPELRKLYMRIQSCDWDKNKSWMPWLERIMNMKK